MGSKILSVLLSSALTFLLASPAIAADPVNDANYVAPNPPIPKFEFFINVGPAKQTGYLTSEESATSTLYGFRALGASGIFSVEFGNFRVKHDTSEFGLTNTYDARVSTFALVPMIRVFERPRTHVALGVAPMLVTVTQASPDNNITYGTFVFAGLARYELNDNWAAHLSTQWYNVEQTFNRSTTTFEVWQNTIGLAYSWNKK